MVKVDTYSLQKNPYVHNNAKYFKTLMERKSLDNVKEDGALYREMETIVIDVLRDHLNYWKELRALFIKKANNLGIIQSNDPQEFLKEWNEEYKFLVENTEVLKGMISYTNIRSDFNEKIKGIKNNRKLNPEEKTRKLLKYIEESYQDLFNGLNAIANMEGDLIEKWRSFLLNKGKEDLINKSNFTSVKKVLKSIETLKNFTGIKELDEAEELIKKSQSTGIADYTFKKGGANAYSMKEAYQKFYFGGLKQNLWNWQSGEQINLGLPDNIGTAYEAANVMAIASSDRFSKLLDDEDFIPGLGQKLENYTVTDTTMGTITKDSKDIKFGVSVKLLERTRSLDKPYSAVDFINTNYLESKISGKTTSLNDDFIKTIKWLRANIRSINTFTPKNRTQESLGGFIDEYMKLERRLAQLSTVPRFLDGIYDYQQTDGKLIPGSAAGARYHTALLLSNERYIWVADILEKFLNSLDKEGGVITFPREKIQANSLKYFNEGHLEKLWQDKKLAMRLLKGATNYDTLYNSTKSIIDRLYQEGIADPLMKRVQIKMNFKQFK